MKQKLCFGRVKSKVHGKLLFLSFEDLQSCGGLLTKLCLTLKTPWTVACQAPLSMGFFMQECWSGLHFLLQGIFLTQGSNPGLLHYRQTLNQLN